MPLVRPRLTEYHGLDVAQANVDFAIPFLEEDLPLYVDPFLLWKSPSLQDQSLHGAIIAAFNRLGMNFKRGDVDQAILTVQQMSECEEVGLGDAAKKKGNRLYLDELNEDDLPQNSDVVLILSQTAAAMEAFEKRYYRRYGSSTGWQL